MTGTLSPAELAKEEFEDVDSTQPAALVMVLLFVFIGAMIRQLPLKLQRYLPYTVIVLMVGFGVGAIGASCDDHDSFWCYPFEALTEKLPHIGIAPITLQLLTLAPLIFAELFHTDFYVFRNIFWQAFILACPGVLLGAILMCLFVKYSYPQYFDWNTGMMFGAMLAASDPVAVLAGMKELGADLRLITIISLESIMNDGCAVVLFMPFFGAAFDDEAVEAGDIVVFTIINIFGAAALGMFYCFVTVMILKWCRKEMPVVVSICVVAPFFCYYTAVLLGTSGILSLVPFALGLRLFSNNFLWGHVDEASLAVWELIEYMVNTFTFLLSGVIMVVNLWSSDITGEDVLHLLWIYLFSLAARAFTILVFYPLLWWLGSGFSFRDAVLTWVAGLRGVVGLSMAMIVHFAARNGHPLEATGQRFMFHMGGVYFLTAIINASVSLPLTQFLKLDAKPRARLLAMVRLSDECSKHVSALADTNDNPDSTLAEKGKELSTRCRDAARAVLLKGELDPEAGDTDADLEGERRRMLDACTKQYRDYFEEGKLSMSACWVLNHVSKNATFHCDAEIERWSVVSRYCTKFLSWSGVGLGLGPFFSNLGTEIAWGFFETQKSVRATLSCPPISVEMEKEEVGADSFMELLNTEHPKALQKMRARHLAFTARNDVVGKIHKAVGDGKLHTEEAKVLEEIAEKITEHVG